MLTNKPEDGMVPGPPFWRSRANLVGVGLAALVIVIHLAVGLGFLWPIVALAAWGTGALLTPAPKPTPIPAPPPVEDPRQLLHRLAYDCWAKEEMESRPEEIRTQVEETKRAVAWVLRHFHELDDAPEQQMQYTNVVREFLPKLEASYRTIYDPHDKRAIGHIVESLSIIETEAKNTRQAIIDENVAELETQARSLKIQYGQFNEGLPPSSSDPTN